MTPDLRAGERPVGRTRGTLDLFAFPSDTRGWFRMLVVAAFLVGLNVVFLAAQRLHRSQDIDARERLEALIAEMTGGRDLRDYSPQEMEELGRRLAPITRELLRSRRPRLVTTNLFVLLLLAAAFVVYVDHPRRYRRCHRSRALDEDEAPTVVRYVRRCAASLGLRQPKLEWRTGIGNDAQTFGLSGREVMLFFGSPRELERVWTTRSGSLFCTSSGI